ncbi:GTPase ObgE [Fimbriiglobus ruber]|uniref:GTPase Obg n=1 Tax=Fimbriiglobus ruber TaxID=1908690 RepID=A0A225D581_9BACT|nr:GTPase ObgE [Fimbriiglobus ruber]OWK36642.1 GTP-binding protein Obg [Fimbriiglobus ruber]
MFVDRVELFVKGGDGGRGMVSFRREKYVPRGGPDGGDGGDGGSVIVIADANADNLAPLLHKKHWRAKSGDPGGTSLCAGSDAGDLIILVPPGTTVRDRDRGNLLKDLVENGDTVVVGKGGKGGKGNKYYASATNRTPREFGPGEEGEERWITLELKVIADAGLVGFPNAGKSTLLSRLSRATPEIADYPFTTKTPNLGIVSLGGDAVFVLADLPGLIEGASQGVGLGHEFLRHVERTRVIIHLVEPFPMDESDPIANYHAIRKELSLYNIPMTEKPEVVCVSKAELTGSDEVRARLETDLCHEVFLVSSVTGQGLAQVVGKAAQLIAEMKEQERKAKEKTKRVEFPTESAVRTGPMPETESETLP